MQEMLSFRFEAAPENPGEDKSMWKKKIYHQERMED
jgi:hypothetical protein